jgi:hypothetical protein
MDFKTLVYFGFLNKDIPWGGWHVTVCGRTNLSTKDMTNAVRRAIRAADLEMDDLTIADWCNERDCFIERVFIWIKNARIMSFENCLREILNETHGIRMKKHFNADGYFHISLPKVHRPQYWPRGLSDFLWYHWPRMVRRRGILCTPGGFHSPSVARRHSQSPIPTRTLRRTQSCIRKRWCIFDSRTRTSPGAVGM